MNVKILADFGDVLAVFKPAGWLSVPGRGLKEGVPVLSHELGAQLRGSSTKSSTPDLFVVHRLDEGTSGVMLFARTAVAHRELSQAFESHKIKKTYWAIVKGELSAQTIDAPIFKIPSKKIKSVVSQEKGKPSQTIVRPLKTSKGFSLVEATPLTGRSHQIRVHLAHIGCPIVGDKLYGAGTEPAAQYPMLHAQALSFEWPAGTKREVSENPSAEFLAVANSFSLL